MVEPNGNWNQQAPIFVNALLNSDTPTPAFLTSSFGCNDTRRFAVYRNNVMVGLIRAMEANFPTIVRLVGVEFFTAMAHVFVSSHPPRSRLMFEYGAEFPTFLEVFEPVRPYPYLADVARVEKMWREAFHEVDAPVVTAKNFSEFAIEQLPSLRLKAHPASRILNSRFSAGSIFTANRADNPRGNIDPAQSEWVLMTRPELDCEVRILGAASGTFINALISGETLEDAALIAMSTNEPFNFAANISGLIASGAFTSIQGVEP
jgi:hypothetical protein